MVDRLTLLRAMVEGITKKRPIWADLRFSVNRPSGRAEHPKGEKRVYKGKESWAIMLT